MSLTIQLPPYQSPRSMAFLPLRSTEKDHPGRHAPWKEIVSSFDLKNDPSAQDGVYVLRDEQQMLEFFQFSGSVRWTRKDPYKHAWPPPDGLPDPQKALAEAKAFLKAHNLDDDRAVDVSMDQTLASRTTADGKTEGPVRVELHVVLRFRLGDFPVIGPGAKIQVTFGPSGQIVRAHRFWRELSEEPYDEKAAQRKVLSEDELLAKIGNSKPIARLSDGSAKADIDEVRIGYLAAGPRHRQMSLVPVFVPRLRITTRLRKNEPYWPLCNILAVHTNLDERPPVPPSVRPLLVG